MQQRWALALLLTLGGTSASGLLGCGSDPTAPVDEPDVGVAPDTGSADDVPDSVDPSDLQTPGPGADIEPSVPDEGPDIADTAPDDTTPDDTTPDDTTPDDIV
ncbi:MAG: hypothetical protein ACI9WU_002512, partial [Myxococcota bacterium]